MKNERFQIEFPCEFPIKIMGKSGDDFELAVFSIMQKHVPDLNQSTIQQKPSKKGNFTAFTVTITAQSQQQLDNIYTDLSANEHVIMAL